MAAADFIKSLVPGAQKVRKNITSLPVLSLLKAVWKAGSERVAFPNKLTTCLG